jgi:hypothetical protein
MSRSSPRRPFSMALLTLFDMRVTGRSQPARPVNGYAQGRLTSAQGRERRGGRIDRGGICPL